MLMEKYRDVALDYVDASLVCLADDLSIPNVVTFDVRSFRIYRSQRYPELDLLNLLIPEIPRAARPEPSRRMVAGSGTGAGSTVAGTLSPGDPLNRATKN